MLIIEKRRELTDFIEIFICEYGRLSDYPLIGLGVREARMSCMLDVIVV